MRAQVFSQNVPISDLQTAAARPIITGQQKTGSVVSATGRYLYKLKHLQSIMTGPSAFKIKIEVRPGPGLTV